MSDFHHVPCAGVNTNAHGMEDGQHPQGKSHPCHAVMWLVFKSTVPRKRIQALTKWWRAQIAL